MNGKSSLKTDPPNKTKSRVKCGKVTKRSEAKVRGLSAKQHNAKTTRSNPSKKSINIESSQTRLCVDMNENSTIDSLSPTSAALVIDEDIVFDEENNENIRVNKPVLGEEPNSINKAKLNDAGVTPPLTHRSINTIAKPTDSSVSSLTKQFVDADKHFDQQLSKSISFPQVEVGRTAQRQNSGFQHQQQINTNVSTNSFFTHSPKELTLSSNLDTGLYDACTRKGLNVRNPATDRLEDLYSGSNLTSISSQSAVALGNCNTTVSLFNKKVVQKPFVKSNACSSINDAAHNHNISDHVKQNKLLLQALPEYCALEREVKRLRRLNEQWSHDFQMLERKYEDLKANSFPRPSADGHEFLKQLLDCLLSTSSDNDDRTNVELAADLGLTLEQLISAEHDDPQRTALNIFNLLYPTNSKKSDLVSIREMATKKKDILNATYVFARRSSPGTSFNIRQLKNALGMSIRQARYRENLSNHNILILGENLKNRSNSLNDDNDEVQCYGAESCKTNGRTSEFQFDEANE